jgi:hypothetical protein
MGTATTTGFADEGGLRDDGGPDAPTIGVPYSGLCDTAMPLGMGQVDASDLSCPPLASTQKCPELCGNGVIDTCEFVCPFEMPPPCRLVEPCDGTNLAGQTCQSVGYASGPLSCGASCELDTTGCERCAPLGMPVRWCGAVPIDAREVMSFALEGTDDEVGLAWIAREPVGMYAVHFARLSSSLEIIQQVGPLHTGCADQYMGVHIASRPGGWLLAIDGQQSLRLLVLDRDSHVVGDREVAEPGFVPFLASRPDGDPLIGWRGGELPGGPNSLKVAVVEPWGVWEGMCPARFPWDSLEASASWVGDGWLLAFGTESKQHGVDMHSVPIDRNGLPGEPILLTGNLGDASLLADGGDVRIVYRGIDQGGIGETRIQHLTSRGVPVGSFTSLGQLADDNVYGPFAAIGNRTSAVMPIHAGGGSKTLRIVTLDSNGAKVDTPSIIAFDPKAMQQFSASRRGPEVIIAWLNGSPYGSAVSIGMARIAP